MKNTQNSVGRILPFLALPLALALGLATAGCGDRPSAASTRSGAQKPPNILIITVDNVGFGDLRLYNKQSPVLTPNLEKLASQGALLTDFYTASPTCSASRAALLTGRIPQRNKLHRQLGGLEGNYGVGLPQSEVIIPRAIEGSPANYATGAFGKWNIGFAPGSRPTERGFHEFLGIASGNVDHFTHVYSGQHDLYHKTEAVSRPGQYSTDLFADAAIGFIKEKTRRATPWLVYLPFDAPHHPGDRNVAPGKPNIWQAPDYAFKPYGLSPGVENPKDRFNAIMTAIDMAIGRVMDTLDGLGIAENTFVFFYSDNGAFYPYIPPRSDIQSNHPLRGAGVTLFEAGIRVPAVARWPGKIAANTTISTRLWSPDLFVTSVKLAGAELPKDRFIDGKDPLPVLTGQTDVSPHAALYFHYNDHQALLWGDYKIVRENPRQDWELFNVKEDKAESNNLASRADLVSKLSHVYDLKAKEIEGYLEREARRRDKLVDE